jgi:hypothetical protein
MNATDTPYDERYLSYCYSRRYEPNRKHEEMFLAGVVAKASEINEYVKQRFAQQQKEQA